MIQTDPLPVSHETSKLGNLLYLDNLCTSTFDTFKILFLSF